MTTNDATPRERIAATWWEGGSDEESADATIRMLWSMADDPAVIEATSQAQWEVVHCTEWMMAPEHQQDQTRQEAKAAIAATLTALLGPRPQGENE